MVERGARELGLTEPFIIPVLHSERMSFTLETLRRGGYPLLQ